MSGRKPAEGRIDVTELLNSKSRRQFLASLGTVGALGIAGCSSSSGSASDSDSDSGSDGSSGETEETAADLSSGRTLRANIAQQIGTIDPAKGTDYVQSMALINMYDSLVFPTGSGSIEPALATDWSISDDNLSYTFTLREDAVFHSGNDVTAEDVKFSFERLMDIGQGFAGNFAGVLDTENITAEDDYTVSFELNEPFSPFLAMVVLVQIVDKKLIMDNLADGEFGDRGDYGQDFINENDAGSGAYELQNFTPGSGITFTRFPDAYHEFPEDGFDTVNVSIITENSTVQSKMNSGNLDMTGQYQSSETYQAIENMDGARVVRKPEFGLLYMKINTQKPPCDDVKFREAMAWGFDYEQVVNDIVPNKKPAQGPIAPKWDVHDSDVMQPSYDPERAKSALEESKYDPGEFTIKNTFTASYGFQERIGLLFKDNMEDLGIEVELNPQTWGTITELATSVEDTPHTNQVFWGGKYPSPDSVFYSKFHSEAANTWISMNHLDDEKVDSMIEEARATADPEKRTEIYQELQSVIANKYTDLNVYHMVKSLGLRSDIEGLTIRPAGGYEYRFRDLH
jgi:peptide/nickel transport system substrate-binding protein